MSITKERALWIYNKMNEIRDFEETAYGLFEQNKLRGSVHLCTGEEAIPATVCSTLTNDDYITSTHRGHGHCIAKGAELDKALAELMGKATGYCKGRGGPMLQAALGWLFSWKFAVLVFLLVLSVIVYRPFCRYLCPLGAVYGLFNPIAFYRLKIDEDKCTKCGICQKSCKLNIEVYKTPNSFECIRCKDCVKACPHGAISTTFERKQKKG